MSLVGPTVEIIQNLKCFLFFKMLKHCLYPGLNVIFYKIAVLRKIKPSFLVTFFSYTQTQTKVMALSSIYSLEKVPVPYS